MRTSLLASTDTPGSTPPLVSLTSPEIVLCAAATAGTNSTPIISPTIRLREILVDMALLGFLPRVHVSDADPTRFLYVANYTDDLPAINMRIRILLVAFLTNPSRLRKSCGNFRICASSITRVPQYDPGTRR